MTISNVDNEVILAKLSNIHILYDPNTLILSNGYILHVGDRLNPYIIISGFEEWGNSTGDYIIYEEDNVMWRWTANAVVDGWRVFKNKIICRY